MTRAVDRLIVSGAIDPERPSERTTPIGWVLDRLDARGELANAGRDPVELERGGARLLVRVDRSGTTSSDMCHGRRGSRGRASRPARALQRRRRAALPPVAPRLPELVPIPLPALEPVRRLSFTALASFESCSYRYYAERLVGMKALRPAPRTARPTGSARSTSATPCTGCSRRSTCAIRTSSTSSASASGIRASPRTSSNGSPRSSRRYCASPLAQRVAALDDVRAEVPFTFEHDGVLIRGFLDVLHRAGERALVVDYKTNVVGEAHAGRDRRRRTTGSSGSSTRSRASGAARREVEVVYHFLERPDAIVSARLHGARTCRCSRPSCRRRSRASRPAEFVPTPSEYACAGCPALDVVCAGPRLRAAPQHLEAVRAGLTCDHLVTYSPGHARRRRCRVPRARRPDASTPARPALRA